MQSQKRVGERTCDRKLRNTTPKYLNVSTQSRAIKNTKTHKPRAKLQEIYFFFLKKKKHWGEGLEKDDWYNIMREIGKKMIDTA